MENSLNLDKKTKISLKKDLNIKKSKKIEKVRKEVENIDIVIKIKILFY